ncbi:MAG: DJ-1 family glyoxalase III [Sphaerochaetaceae bacterium]|jgi:4-methyl-5(b-hydroxyethyl)-thiazole monophosphate biosynthesis|nr:DJ-1/PfpI family protein [Sphaerochaetaceae bacterium]HHU89316.1 DJ-1/PfpI family protein [Spirochaetales bacterium]
MSSQKVRVLVPLANGFEEIEAITPIDIFRRAGWDVVVAGVGGLEIEGAHGIKVCCDTLIDEVGVDFKAIVLPGGGLGSKNLAESWAINEKMLLIANSGGLIAAICAAPAVVLGPAGLLEGRKAVCYPGVEEYVPNFEFSDERVCVDGNLITARAAGCAVEFALAIVTKLASKQLSDEIAKAILFK